MIPDKATVQRAVEMLRKNGVRPPYELNQKPNYITPDIVVGTIPGSGIAVTDEHGELLPEWR